TTPEGRGVGVERLIYSPDDSISLSLEYLDGEEEDVSCTSSHSSESGQENGVSKRYLQCPALVTIGHLKKFLRNKYELTPLHTVEIVHRRESLPDDYTLMDVAYIYTWKRNGPMRFFFRIIQSKPVVSAVVQSTPSLTNGPVSVQDSTSTQISSQLTNTVPHSTQPISSNSENVPSKSPPKVESPKPTPKPDSRLHEHELQKNISVEENSAQLPEVDTVVSSETVNVSCPPTSTTQSTSTFVTKCTQSKTVPVTSSSPITCVVTPTQSNQTTCDDIKDKETNKSVTTSPSHEPPAAVTKTETVVNPIPSLPTSNTYNVPSLVSEANTNVISANVDLVADVSVQDTPLSTPNPLSQNNPTVPENKSSQKQTSLVTEQSIPKSNTKDITQPSTTKIPVSQPIKENQKQQNQPVASQPSGGNSLTQKLTQISNGVSNSTDSEVLSQTPLAKPPAEVNCATQSQEERPTKLIKTEPEQTTPNGNVKVLKEDSQKSITTNNSTALGTPTNPKALLNKQILQRLQNSARKTSIPMKFVSDPSSTKAPQSTVRTQSQITKDSVKFPRVNQKSGDKQVAASDITTSKKENTQAKSNNTEKNETVKESSHITSNLQIKSEKDALNSTATPHTPVNNTNNNNINKVPPQNQQIIRNNQQILRKNDEIMRCVTTVKRPIHPIPRKTSDVLKNSAQFRAAEDKMNAKKRRLAITNSMKRSAPTPLDPSKIDEVQPMIKKLKPTIENHKPSVFEQKQPQTKMRFANTLPGQTPLYTPKSEPTIESTSNSMKNGSSNTFNASVHISGSENKCNIKTQESERKNCVNEKAASIAVHRPQHNIQTSLSPKMSINSAIKKESPSSKPEIQSAMRRSPASTLSGQNMTPPPMPAAAHSNIINSRPLPTPHPPTVKTNSSGDPDGAGALDLSSSPRRQQSQSILSIAQSLARRQQQQCPSPAPPPLSPLSALSPFPVMASLPVRSPPPQLRIPIPPQHRTGHPHQQQRPSSLSSSSPSPPADTMPGSSRMGPPQQQQQPLTPDMYPPHLLNPAALMFRQQLELQRLWSSGKHNNASGMEWFTDANSVKRFESFMKSLQQQQQQQQQNPGRNSPFYPFNNNNTAAAANNHRK
ncbi:hypothetical protein C0J52_04915, partial [Blattella germanica]